MYPTTNSVPLLSGYLWAKTNKYQFIYLTRKCVYETLCPQPYACPEKRFKSERSATQTIRKLISSSTPISVTVVLVLLSCQDALHTDTNNQLFNIGIKHSFSCINVCQVPREMLKTSAERLPGPSGDVENLGRRPRFSTSPEGPGKR